MSLRNDQSPEINALDAFAEQHRRGEAVVLPDEEELKAFAATMAAGTPVSVVRLSARNPWIDDLAALYCFNASRWDTPADLVYCFPNQAPAGSWDIARSIRCSVRLMIWSKALTRCARS